MKYIQVTIAFIKETLDGKKFDFQLRGTKMYQNLHQHHWWNEMKTDIAKHLTISNMPTSESKKSSKKSSRTSRGT